LPTGNARGRVESTSCQYRSDAAAVHAEHFGGFYPTPTLPVGHTPRGRFRAGAYVLVSDTSSNGTTSTAPRFRSAYTMTSTQGTGDRSPLGGNKSLVSIRQGTTPSRRETIVAYDANHPLGGQEVRPRMTGSPTLDLRPDARASDHNWPGLAACTHETPRPVRSPRNAQPPARTASRKSWRGHSLGT